MAFQEILSFTSEDIMSTKNGQISLEFMLARELTPIMSRHYSLAFERKACENRTMPQSVGQDLLQLTKSIPARVRSGELFHRNAKDSFLVPKYNLSDDINLIGVYGMGIDLNTNHWWYGTNHLGIIHELDGEFNLINQYTPRCVENFRNIVFKDNKAYVVDAGVRREAMLHIFTMPDFLHEDSISLENGYSFFSPQNIFLNNGHAIISFESNAYNCTKLEQYQIEQVDLETRQINSLKIQGLSTIFQHSTQFYGVTDFRDRENVLKPGYGSTGVRFLTKLDEAYQPTGNIVEIDHSTSTVLYDNQVYVDRRGTLFHSGRIYNQKKDTFGQHLICSTIEAKLLRMQQLHTDLSIGPMVFDAENNLIVLLHYNPKEDSRLIAVKYKVLYPDTR